LRKVFAFHPLAVDDALIESHVPKVDDWGDYLYIVLHAVNFQHGLTEIETQEVDVFVGPNYLVTHHTIEINALERQWQATLRDERHTRRGVDYLLYELCDSIATDYMPCMDRMEDVIGDLEDRVFEGSNSRTVQAIFKLKAAVLALRRVLSPQREVLNKLARGDFAVIDERDRVYFRDVYDHFVRLADLNESLRDLTSGALDTYLSVTANRTNEVMKALTIVTVLFMPLTFITGFFGMNFFGGSIELIFSTNPWLFFAIAMLIMVAVPLAMVMYIRHRGWW
jgi:magnesium transporter